MPDSTEFRTYIGYTSKGAKVFEGKRGAVYAIRDTYTAFSSKGVIGNKQHFFSADVFKPNMRQINTWAHDDIEEAALGNTKLMYGDVGFI